MGLCHIFRVCPAWRPLPVQILPAQDAKRAARAALRSAQTHAELAAAVQRAEALGLATEAAAGKRKLAKMPGAEAGHGEHLRSQ